MTGISVQAQTQAVALGAKGSTAAANALGFAQLQKLHQEAVAKNPASILAVAKQFESMLVNELLTSMGKTSFGSDLLGQTSGPMFQSLFNQQIAQTVSQGQGIGLASTLAKEIATRYHLHWDAQIAQRAAAASRPVTIPAEVLPGAVADSSPGEATSWTAPSGSLLTRAKAFVREILPAVREAAAQLGVSPVSILAQAALETGWGAHAPGNNLFGIKGGGGWDGSTLQNWTHEFVHGAEVAENDSFRAYQNVAASVENYAQLLLNSPRYRAALNQGNNVAGFAQALQAGGYATAPNYAESITALAKGPVMQAALAGTGLAP